MFVPKVTLREDGILHFIYPPGMSITVGMMEDVLSRHKVLAPNRKSPILVELERGDPLDREIKAFTRRRDVVDHTLAMAVVTGGRIGAMLANIYLHVTPLPYPSRLFSNRDKAISWLQDCQRGDYAEPEIHADKLGKAEYFDFGSQASHMARLYFALDDAVKRLEDSDGQQIREIERMQMRLLAHDVDMELQGVHAGSRLDSFLADTGFDSDEVRQKLDRFHELAG